MITERDYDIKKLEISNENDMLILRHLIEKAGNRVNPMEIAMKFKIITGHTLPVREVG